jgi:hypothetical protein
LNETEKRDHRAENRSPVSERISKRIQWGIEIEANLEAGRLAWEKGRWGERVCGRN